MPSADYNGPDSAMIKAQDIHGSGQATVSITVTPVNDAPVAKADSFSTAFGVPLTIAAATLLMNDTDVDNATLTVTNVAAVADSHGGATMTGTDIVFTPEAGFVGTGKFVYTVSDGTLTATATVTITIATDLAPTAVADAVATDEDIAAAINDTTLLANDTDPEHQTLAISAVGNATHGTVTHSGTQVSFVPDANYNGPASFEYTITDGQLTSTTTVAITVNAIDDPPVAVDDVMLVAESVLANSIDVLANDTDIDDGPKTIASFSQPAHGTVALAGAGASLSYTSAAGYCNNEVPNAPPDSFTYTLSPGGSTATVQVKVSCACGVKHSTDFVVGSNP